MHNPSVFIITGEQGEGKSSFAKDLAEKLQKANFKVGGFTATGRLSGSLRSGFDLTPVGAGEPVPLAERAVSAANPADAFSPQPGLLPNGAKGNFLFNEQGLKTGEQIIKEAAGKNETEIFILDEIGIFELNGEVWARPLELLLKTYRGVLVVTVRGKLLERVIEKWQINPSGIFNICMISVKEAADAISGSPGRDTARGLPKGQNSGFFTG